MNPKQLKELDAELDKKGITSPSDVPTLLRRYKAKDGKYYNGYMASPDYLDAVIVEEKEEAKRTSLSEKAAKYAERETSRIPGETKYCGSKKREKQINALMENVKFCAEHDLRHVDESQTVARLRSELERAKEIERLLTEKFNEQVGREVDHFRKMLNESRSFADMLSEALVNLLQSVTAYSDAKVLVKAGELVTKHKKMKEKR